MYTPLFFLLALSALVSANAFDDYINKEDNVFKWNVTKSFDIPGGKGYILYLQSVQWLTKEQNSHPIWNHWIEVCIPDELSGKDWASIYFDNGRIDDPPPDSIYPLVELLCLTSGTLSARLHGIPNEPIMVDNDGHYRTEDNLIAKTWSVFLNDPTKADYLLRFPMAKAGLKALDAIQEFAAKTQPQLKPINNFLVAGASKRAWTTWMAAAGDKVYKKNPNRIKAIAPLVLPILELNKVFKLEWSDLGNWSFAIKDYIEFNIPNYLDTPAFTQMRQLIDPIFYLDRFQMPKYIIDSTGDEFTMPTSPSYFYDQLLGETHLKMNPNCEHSCATCIVSVGDSVATYYKLLINDMKRPVVNFTYTDGVITAVTDTKPKVVKVWHSTTLPKGAPFPYGGRRDWRLIVGDSLKDIQWVPWFEKELAETGSSNGKYSYKTGPYPPPGNDNFLGYFIELTFDWGWEEDMLITSQVNVSPDTFPFPPFVPTPPHGPPSPVPPAREPVLQEPDFSRLDLSALRARLGHE